MKFCFFFFALLSFNCFAKFQLDNSKWEKSVDEDGVIILSQKIKGNDIIAFRTIYTVNANIDQLLSVLRDAKGSLRWVKDLKSLNYINEPSDLEAIIYEVRNFPWPFEDRDLIIHYLLSINEDRKSISVKFNSIDHPNYPKRKHRVRAYLEYGLFEFWPQGDKTKIELTILADPKGKIPSWVVNLFSKTQPFNYIKQLEKEAKKTKIPVRDGIKKAIEEYKELTTKIAQ